jgi:leader peptidase (prepilin peptidase) / N-methyltransferase
MNSAETAIRLAAEMYATLVGLLLGSFINLVADRLPRGESLVRPRSHCRSCGRILGFLDLIPVVGYAVRRGRCASCRASIGASSPVIEAVCGGAMLAPLIMLGILRGTAVGILAISLVGAGVVGLSFVQARAVTRGSRWD